MKNLNIHHMRAYANGALDGYNTGSENNPYDTQEKPEEAQAYKLGYDYGVAMYCQDNEHHHIDCPSVDGFACHCEELEA